jgi:hypothetical protein
VRGSPLRRRSTRRRGAPAGGLAILERTEMTAGAAGYVTGGRGWARVVAGGGAARVVAGRGAAMRFELGTRKRYLEYLLYNKY